MSERTTSAAVARDGGGGLTRKSIPLAVLAIGLIAFFALGGTDHVSFEALRENRQALLEFVRTHGFAAGLVYMTIYALSTAFSLPVGTLLTIAGGFLFGVVAGGFYIVVGATVGATVVFLAAKHLFDESLRSRYGGLLKKMETGFQENALSYMFVLRLVPLFPFWAVNLLPALLGVRTAHYVLATVLGSVPGVFVYASVGNGLGQVFDRGEEPNMAIILEPQIIGPIVGLAILAMIPVAYRKTKRRREPAK